MKKKVLSVAMAICLAAGVLPGAAYAREAAKTEKKETAFLAEKTEQQNIVSLSTLITDTVVDNDPVWEAGAVIAAGTTIRNDTGTDLEIYYVQESVAAIPQGAAAQTVAAGADKEITLTGGGVTTAGVWKICGSRKGGTYGEPAVTVKSAIVLYPSAAEYTVSFEMNGHGTALPDVTGVSAGSKIEAPVSPSAAGYTFGGWYKEAGCINAWDFKKDTVNESLTLYAKWTRDSSTAAISSVTPTGAVYGYTQGSAKVSAEVVLPAGYTCTYQWYSNVSCTNSGGSAISGAVAPEYSLPAGQNAGDYYYYCVVTVNGNGQNTVLTSEAVTVTIKKAVMTVNADNVTKKHDGTSTYGITVDVTVPGSGYTTIVKKFGEKEGIYDLPSSPVYKDVGTRTVYYQVTDTANNYETYTGSAVVKIVDGTAPTGSIEVADKTYTGFVSNVSFGTYLETPQEVYISIDDSGSGPDEIYYYISQTALTAAKVQSKDVKWKVYEEEITLKKDKKYIIYAKLTDMAGNIRYISTNGLVLDGTAPAISGVKDGGAYCKSVSITVTDDNLSKVMVDSTSKTISGGKSTFTLTGDGKQHTITATDKVGNETEYTFTMRTTHSLGEYKTVKTEGEWSLEESSCQYGCGTVYKRYRKNSEIIAEEDPSGGSISTDVEVRSGVLSASISGLDTALARSLVSDAATQAAKGVDVLLYLDVARQDTVGSSDKTATENAVKQYKVQNLKEGMYLDLSLYQKKGSNTATKISKNGLGKNLKISLALPQELQAAAGTGRTYYVVRVHNGTATVLSTTLNNNVISFETDRFSTYSIWYTENGSGTTVSGNASGTQSATAAAAGQKDTVPKTGDEDMGIWYGLLCLAGGTGTLYFGRKKFLKKRDD